MAAKRADDLLAELFEMTREHVEMSRWIAGRPPGATKFSSVKRAHFRATGDDQRVCSHGE